jgi:hypothetical protein
LYSTSAPSVSSGDELRRVARELARLGDDRDDRLADVTHLADGEGVVLQVCAGRRRELEERVRERGHLLAGKCPVDALDRLRLRDVDRGDVRVGVRRAHEVHVAHPVTLDVVDEHALALREALVLLARHVLARVLGRYDLDRRGLDRRRGAAHVPAALTASMMFQ